MTEGQPLGPLDIDLLRSLRDNPRAGVLETGTLSDPRGLPPNSGEAQSVTPGTLRPC